MGYEHIKKDPSSLRSESAQDDRRKIDYDQVVAMSIYLTNALIAERLGISERQVSRILAKHGVSKNRPVERKNIDNELVKMQTLTRIGLTYGQIAWRFGLSRQAVHQKLTG